MTAKTASDLVGFATASPERSQTRPAAERILSGDPLQTTHNYYTDPTGRFFAGVWECEPGLYRFTATEEEFCLILAGRATLTDASGGSRTYATGDAFVIPAGFTGTWETVERLRKYYAIMTVPEAA